MGAHSGRVSVTVHSHKDVLDSRCLHFDLNGYFQGETQPLFFLGNPFLESIPELSSACDGLLFVYTVLLISFIQR